MARHPLWLGICLALLPSAAGAQSLGSFSWQLAPFCNVITVNVTQTGTTYTLDGYDNQCGGSTRAVVLGIAVPNPTGTIALGFAIVTPPAGTPVHVTTNIDLASLGGSWSDDQGNTGTFVFTPSGVGSGTPRPPAQNGVADDTVTSATIVDGAVGGADINDAEVQRRVSSACPSSQLMTAVNQDGTVVCQAVPSGSGGDITAVNAGAGLTGGGTTGDVTLQANLGQLQARVATGCPANESIRTINQNGTVVCEPDSDSGGDITGVTAGAGLSGGASAGTATLAVVFGGTGAAATAARGDHTHALGTTSLANSAVGDSALAGPSPGYNNTAVGYSVMVSSAAGGNSNTGVGAFALEDQVNGFQNTAVGSHALASNVTGWMNTAIGADALDGLNGPSSGTSSRHTAIGKHALGNLTQGYQNTALGAFAGDALVTGDENVYIHNSGAATESRTIRIGTSVLQTRAFLAGVRGVATGQNDAVAVVVDSSGQLGTVSSTRRSKFDIGDLSPQVSGALQNLRPVQFRYRQAFADGTTPLQYGLIAEEVQEVLPALVAEDDQGQPATVKYYVLPSLLLAEVQRLERERRAQAAVATTQEQRIAELERALAVLETAMSRFAGPPPM